MGDISRHRDIFLFTRGSVPADLLARSQLTANDLTYLELGNYLTDVSQFRDPVVYIFAKQRIWRDIILPSTGESDLVRLVRALGVAGAAAALGASQYLKDKVSGAGGTAVEAAGGVLAGIGGILAVLPNDLYADFGGADEWIDGMFGVPLEQISGDPDQQAARHYGDIGQFFRHFIEGITHVLFAHDVKERQGEQWRQVEPIPPSRVTEIYGEFFTQYYPHEHSDQPPYVWDASKRPANRMYQPSRRQRSLADPRGGGVMNAVDVHYVRYLAEELTDVEQRWRALPRADATGRQRLLVRLGKLLHGIEDWFFHSNVVEILRIRGHAPAQGEGEDDEAFLRRFVTELAATEPEFVAADPPLRRQLTRKLFRRLRFPVYERGTRTESAGRISDQDSHPAFRHAYPAFPSQQDTHHTLLHALENLEHKLTHPGLSGSGPHLDRLLAQGLPGWLRCVLGKFLDAGGEGSQLLSEKAAARGVGRPEVSAALLSPGPQREQALAVMIDVLREWVPLVVTLLSESERQRLVADVDPLRWPADAPAPPGQLNPEGVQLKRQQQLHRAALRPRPTDGDLVENNYQRAARYLAECGFINDGGRKALDAAFALDWSSQQRLAEAPGAGGFLIQFAVELQQKLDAADAATAGLNQRDSALFGKPSDNGSSGEIVGSHSLMSKDTLVSTPLFDHARVLASVASSSVLTILLEQVSAPAADRRLVWIDVLHHFIRFPPARGGWERRAMAHFRQHGGKIPSYADLPELARLVASATRPAPSPRTAARREREELEERYRRLEAQLSHYRYGS